MRVALLPTGRTEWEGFGQALGSLFPSHEFFCLPQRIEIDSNPERFPYPGFTSSPLTEAHEQDPPEAARDLVERAAQEALGDRRREPADLVVILDDLEIPNSSQPERVTAVMRHAVQRHVQDVPAVRAQERTRKALLERVSFHLVAPMIEAWFFADPTALARAGVPDAGSVVFAAATDPEAFETSDPAYLGADETICTAWLALPASRRKKLRPRWLGSQPREKHPKGYLQWLCRCPDERSCTCYSETQGGGAALAGIRWDTLLGRPEPQFAFLRSLVHDLEDGLGCDARVRPGGAGASLTARRASDDAQLRNL